MKNILISLLIISLSSCDNIIEEDYSNDTGTTFIVRNNTFGVRDFDVASYKTYPLVSGSYDYGRNFGTGTYTNYQDSIGYITFEKDGTGEMYFYNQDTIETYIPFTFDFYRKNGTQYVNFTFSNTTVKTYSNKEPQYIFGYTKINDSVWVYSTDMSKYNGRYEWFANRISSEF